MQEIVLHKGKFKKTATTAEAVFVITGMTIGAGILALPYAVSRIGLLPGLGYIAALGFITLFFNLMIGEIALRTKEPLQLIGFAGKYLGKWAKVAISFTSLLSAFGALLAYIIAEGISLATLFGGKPVMWSVIFWMAASLLVWSGLQRIKIADKIFGIIIMAIIATISVFLLPKFQLSELTHFDSGSLFFPIGIILFAMHASPAVAEAHALLPGSERRFRRALIWGTLLPTALYLLFSLAVVGYMGRSTTEIATVGLGRALGSWVLIFANMFAVLAMSTCFMGTGVALRETLTWDFKIPDKTALFTVVALPLIFFLLGVNSFIGVLETVGGVCIGVEGLIMAGVYLKARRGYDAIPEHYYSPRHPVLLSLPMFIFFGGLLAVTVYGFLF